MKSPPELWAELSELESLARHLGEFGEIRIRKVDPESRVEWEADRASGTVRLEPSGWGTRVVLTVDTPTPEPEPVVPEPVAVEQPAAEPQTEPEPEPEPAAVEREPAPVKPGWFARLFRRSPAQRPRARRAEQPRKAAPRTAEPGRDEPWNAAPRTEEPGRDEPWKEALRAEEPGMQEPRADTGSTAGEAGPERAEAVPPDRAFGTIEWETPAEPVEEAPEPAVLEPVDAHAVLTGVLDTLGAAHHRPFSRP